MKNILSSIKNSITKKAHSLKPVVNIGQNGLTDFVLN